MSKSKLPWELHPHIWKNSTAFFTYLRGCLRKAWNTNPVKLELIKKSRYQIPNPNPKGNKPTVWGCRCSLCGKESVLKDFQVDHITPSGKLNCKEDIQGFVERLLFVGLDDLRMVCKDCNAVLAYADRHGCSYEEALLEKKVILFKKLSGAQQKERLTNLGYSGSMINTKQRVDAYRSLLNIHKDSDK